MMFKAPQQWFVLKIVFVAAVGLAECETDWTNHVTFSKSFDIGCVITSVEKSIEPRTTHLVELYSAEQKRARLNFNVTGAGNLIGDFVYDLKTDQAINYLQRKCESSDLTQLYTELFPRAPEIRDLFSFIDKEIGDVGFVIGPAKLLFFISHRADEIKKDGALEDLKERVRMHTVAIVHLSVDLNNGSGDVLDITIYYDSHKFNLMESIQNTIPLQIVIESKITERKFVFDYYGFRLKKDDIRENNADHLVDRLSGRSLDVFAFPIALNCSRLLKGGGLTSRDMFGKVSNRSMRLSFIAKTLWTGTNSYNVRHFVAFDAYTGSLRIDSQLPLGTDNRNTINLLDYRVNRRYIIVEDPIYRNEKLSDSTSSRDKLGCVVMRIDSYGKKWLHSFNWDKLLFLTGTSSFSYMGQARVGAAPALVYEGYANDLPEWFSTPTLFKNQAGMQNKGGYFKRWLGKRAKMSLKDQLKTEFSAILYIADPGTSTDQSGDEIKLLRLEFYNLRVHINSPDRRILVTEFHNFIGDLTDAPNGDSSHDLFSRHQLRCADDSVRDNRAKVEILLEEEPGDGKQDSAWLDNWLWRQDATEKGLTDSLYVQSSVIHNLNTRLIKNPENPTTSRAVAVSFELSEGSSTMYQISYLGTVTVLGTTLEKVSTGSSRSLGECLWMLGQNKRAYLYYSELTQTCFIYVESESASKFQKDVDFVTKFAYSENADGEFYDIEMQSDTQSGESWMSRSGITRIENGLMTLSPPYSGVDSTNQLSTELKMRIKRVKFHGLNYLTQDEQLQVKRALVYPGLAFIQSSSYKRLSLGNQDDGSQISLSQCRAACLADLDCLSYSYCARLPEFSCSMSQVSLQQPDISKQLSIDPTTPSGRKIQVRVESAAPKTAGGEGANVAQVVELVRDRKCELHNKVYMDMFERDWVSDRVLKGMQVYAVSGKEECAEICFRRSLQSLSSSKAIAKQLRNAMEANAQDEGEVPPSSDDDDETQGGLLDKLRREHQAASLTFCSHFFYLDKSATKESRNLLEGLKLKGGDTKTEVCAFDTNVSNETDALAYEGDSLVHFQFAHYKFIYSHLYSHQYGFGLPATTLDLEQTNAYRLVKKGTADADEIKMIRKLVKDGYNIQFSFTGDLAKCSKSCFESANLWPACRSFDLITLHKRNSVPVEICHLNTVSLVDEPSQDNTAMKQYSSNSEVEYGHYEPLFGLVGENFDLDFLLGDLKPPSKKREQAIKTVESGSFYLATWLIVIMVGGGLISGLFLGVQLGRLLIGRARREANDAPTNRLITSATIDLNQIPIMNK